MYGRRNLAREKDDFWTRYLWRDGNGGTKESGGRPAACVRAGRGRSILPHEYWRFHDRDVVFGRENEVMLSG